MLEILTDWTTPSGGGKVSVMYFDTSTHPPEAQRDSLQAMWTAIADRLDNAVSWNIRTVGRLLDAASGTLTGEWSDPRAKIGTGTSIGQAMPDAAQGLIRWNTGDVVAGRFLKGRTFIPGIETNQVTDGNLSSACQADLLAAATAFITATPSFAVWHRPTNGAGGSVHPVATAGVWAELAVLRRRRG